MSFKKIITSRVGNNFLKQDKYKGNIQYSSHILLHHNKFRVSKDTKKPKRKPSKKKKKSTELHLEYIQIIPKTQKDK